MTLRTAVLVAAALLIPLGVTACGDDTDTSNGTDATGPDLTLPGDTAVPGDTAAPDDDTDDAGVPTREPEVTGVVALGPGDDGTPTLAQPSEDYYEGMSLLGGDPAIIDAGTGEPLPAEDLAEGDRVEVWVSGPCAESYPVQCGIAVVRVTRST